jgi:hypothetical protein
MSHATLSALRSPFCSPLDSCGATAYCLQWSTACGRLRVQSPLPGCERTPYAYPLHASSYEAAWGDSSASYMSLPLQKIHIALHCLIVCASPGTQMNYVTCNNDSVRICCSTLMQDTVWHIQHSLHYHDPPSFASHALLAGDKLPSH